MNKSIQSAMAGIAALMLTVGCARNMIAYSTSDITRTKQTRFAGATLVVRALADRAVQIQSDPYLEIKDQIERDGGIWRFNHRDSYKNRRISPGISQMLASHIAAAGLFGIVRYDTRQASAADYELRGTILKFDGLVEQSRGERTGIHILSLVFKQRYEGAIILRLRLKETRTDSVLWEGLIEGKVEGEARGEGDAYSTANLSLKDAVNKLIQALEALPTRE